MPDCISEYEFRLCVDPYDSLSAQIRDLSGAMVATVNRRTTRAEEGIAIARMLCAAPAMLRALEVALDAYSPKSHLLGVGCSSQQRQAAVLMCDALRLALYGEVTSGEQPRCAPARSASGATFVDGVSAAAGSGRRAECVDDGRALTVGMSDAH